MERTFYGLQVGQTFYRLQVGQTFLSAALARRPTIKGPGARTRHVIRRVWECPVCKRIEWTGGQATALACTCQAGDPPQPVWMKLIGEPKCRPPSVLPKLGEEPIPGADAAPPA